MRRIGIRGAIRSKGLKTAVPDKARACPQDWRNRQFRAERPNPLRVSGFTCVSTWTGFVFVAFVIDAFARRIAGWQGWPHRGRTAFLLDALEQALRARRPAHGVLIQSIGMPGRDGTNPYSAGPESRKATLSTGWLSVFFPYWPEVWQLKTVRTDDSNR